MIRPRAMERELATAPASLVCGVRMALAPVAQVMVVVAAVVMAVLAPSGRHVPADS